MHFVVGTPNRQLGHRVLAVHLLARIDSDSVGLEQPEHHASPPREHPQPSPCGVTPFELGMIGGLEADDLERVE